MKSLLDFLDLGITPWHVVAMIEKSLSSKGFKYLDLKEPFHLDGKNFYLKKGGTIVAIKLPKNTPERILFAAAHTDSPTFKLKPKPTFSKNGQVFLDIEVYGSPIFASFLNRDLAIAGKIYFENKEGKLEERLIDLKEFPVIIPQLAPHLDRETNEKDGKINPETQLAPLVHGGGEEFNLLKFIEGTLSTHPILGHDLFLYPLEKARNLGFNNDLFASARIDNLGSAFALLKGFEKSQDSEDALQIAIFWNHEEIGSATSEGAASPLFLEILQRIQNALSLDEDWWHRMRHSSFGLSVDQAHATNACHPDKHDLKHEIKLGGGITIKSNAKKRYATSGDLIAKLKILCNAHHIRFQEFVNRNDIPCGSTIGPILSAASGFDIIDIGCPELSMHSAREIASTLDHESMIRLIDVYFSTRS